MVHPIRFERTTFGSASQRSIQLSYGCKCGEIKRQKAFYLSTVQRLNVHHIPKGYNEYYYSTLSLKMVY